MDYLKRKRSPHLQRRGVLSPAKHMSRIDADRNRSPRSLPNSTAKSGRETDRTERNTAEVTRKRRSTPISFDNQLEPSKKQAKPSDRNAIRVSPMKKERNDDHRDDPNADLNEPSSKIRIRSSSQSKYDNLPPR